MPVESEWSLSAPRNITFEEPVDLLDVRLVNGTVNVVGAEGGPARLELTAIGGPPLQVSHRGGKLTVTYEDMWPPKPFSSFQSFRDWFSRKDWGRSADVTLTVPAAAGVAVTVVGAGTVVSGIGGSTTVRGVSGDTTLVGLTGNVRTETVSGRVEAQHLGGDVRCNTVSGDLTVVECTGGRIKADSVNGNVVIDLSPAAPGADLAVTSVSGDVAVRLPATADATVETGTTVGPVSCAFGELRVQDQFGARNITGRLGGGRGRIKVTTVSGAVALLRGPDADERADDRADDRAGGPAEASAETPAQGKVL
ncbi:hypothetical protein FGW37_22195 [Streptomyces rectiverticillatus]|uniref:DUF4097 family beta strand repeat-containing protein n=1 Tax=Streptomyces rectiverticillatus TaxID=173860 RepID=UPI0015C40557|nr:DUF4097 family beta strand repeat-containing protein [Streptomyces rectiverticillatus]QLE73932.1 hypothetical protein FGW37_22195 [Streptomyces rectiverticillatus]